LSIAALVAIATTQAVDDLPECSIICLTSIIPKTGCSPTDTKCACDKADKITPLLTPCLESVCSVDEQERVAEVLTALCEQTGV
ncbi:uncharacterized protein K460DRAFT_249004, partial [Cucurbitaria berberidis CBS 394.84]